MKVSGFSYMRNSFTYGYPVIQSITSVLPLVDEFIAVVGKSDDGTREAIAAIGSPKIRIIDTEWDPAMTKGGKIFAQQANIGLKAIAPDADWAFHIQSDEVIHEKDIPEIRQAMQEHLHDKKVDGFLFPFYHFIGDYKHIGPTRKWHSKEIRITRNDQKVFSYRDSQGFRLYDSEAAYMEDERKNGTKLKVKMLDARVYHYSYCRNPYLLSGKLKKFGSYYSQGSASPEFSKEAEAFDFHGVIDILAPFEGTHPAVMNEVIAKQNWEFKYDPSRGRFKPRHRVLHEIEKITGWRIGEYKNYKLIS
ncbi:glycosyltransferase family 2 protein [Chitinophaga sp. sic0106]|uniref:glycosyltransferase family 2 protein n=1 Tax=Chitinophaga sp. sic0106 TaxID=2854785 RepID=UPI001C485386|nr:glycosyltransferase family 2 protein [Chitinophaga sp. sic0106]MBV7528564.1 glycosyltransferase family 2 protein [Chitinophaga sp. sic0106]